MRFRRLPAGTAHEAACSLRFVASGCGPGCTRYSHGHGLTMFPFLLQVVLKAADIQKSIDEGATAFLATEYYYLSIFMVRGVRRVGPLSLRQPEVSQGAHKSSWRLETWHSQIADFLRHCFSLLQVIFSVLIFSLLSIVTPEDGRTRQDEVRSCC